MRARGSLECTLANDPPPDLAIEVDRGRHAIEKPALYAALGVPELWRYDGRRLYLFRLRHEGGYVQTGASKALPGFPVDEAERTVDRLGAASDTALVRSFRDRIRSKNSPGPEGAK